ncbi:MAG: hypothetical protein ACXVA9_09025 [Bdellovibrionales bacterium]
MNNALAQFWPMPLSSYNSGVVQRQVPGGGYNNMMQGGGYPQTPWWYRQPLPYFQQPSPMFPQYGNMANGYPGGFGFPQQQPSPFGGGMFGGGAPGMFGGGGPGMFGGGGQNHIGLGLNFNLDQLFGGSGLGGGNTFGQANNGWDMDDAGAPYCESCERARVRRQRIRVARDDDDDYQPDYHTEARSTYVRQADSYPAYIAQNDREDRFSDGGGERIANGEEVTEYRRQLPPPAGPITSEPHVSISAGFSKGIVDPRTNVYVQFHVDTHNEDERRALREPFFNLFISQFTQCVPAGCQPAQFAIEGSRGNLSCHPSRRAIDVHQIVCNGDFRHPHRAIDNDPLFNRMVACMGGPEGVGGNRVSYGKMAVIWHQNHGRGIIEDHWTHAHFSPLEGCRVYDQKRGRMVTTW